MDILQQISALLPTIKDENFLQQLLITLQQQSQGQDVFLQLKAAQEEIQSQKVQKEKFFNIVSYELGSPLNSLKSMADFVMMDIQTFDNPFVEESVKMLYAQIEKLQLQMGNLIEWANLEVKNYIFSPETFDCREVVEKSFEIYTKLAATKSIKFEYNAPQQPFYTKADQRMIQLVVNNLVSNAIKFSRKNDTVILQLEQNAANTSIIVKDTGIGIGKSKLENLFNPARKSNQKGTANENGYGIGLLTVKAILDLHQTTLQVESEQGKGSTFIVPLLVG